MSARSRRRHRRASQKRNPFLIVLVVLGSAVMLVILSLGIYVLGVAAEAPSIDELRPVEVGENSVVYAADGSRLGFIQSDEARTPVKWDFIPEDLKDATVAIEDERFYKHGGVDVEGVVRAAFENLEAGQVRQGGSTITMQLARNLFIEDPERDLERKIKEAKIAEELEGAHSKEWILTEYLNTASYGTFNGRTAVGVEAASQIFYSKPVRDLDLAQSAMLAGLPQSPSLYNPLLNPTSALERRNDVLGAMEAQGYISQEESAEARSHGLDLEAGTKYSEIREPYFFDFVEQQLIEEYGVNTVRQGGLKVHTTIDPTLQSAAREAIEGQLYYPDDPSAALVAIDPKTGFVRAMASSGQYADRQFNLAAQGHRQPGSAAKTWALTTAVRRGIDPANTFYNSHPLNIDDPIYGPWEVSTYSNSYAGNISLRDATLASDNSVFAQLALDLGPDSVADTAHDMGIETELDGFPAETLGGLRIGVSPLEMTNAYATLASGGVRNKPIAIRKVVFPDNQTDEIGEPDRKRAFPDGVAWEVTQILEDNIDFGTGTAAGIGCGDEAGKTGTTDEFNDAMFMGFTPKVAAGVWVGYPDALLSMTSVHGIAVAGGTFPAMIWHDFMLIALDKYGCATFPEPEDPVEWIPFHGTYTSDSSENDCEEDPDLGGGFGSTEGLYTECGEKDKKKKNKKDDADAYAPGVGQKPIPKPKPKPEPPPPEPEPEPEPPTTTTTTTPPPSGGTGT